MNVQERGVRKPYPDLRVGVTTKRLLGMQRRHDSSAVPDNAFWELINARLRGGRIDNRGGQEKINTAQTTDGCPELIFDAGDLGVPITRVPYGYAKGGFQNHTIGTYSAWTNLGVINGYDVTDYDFDINADDSVKFSRIMAEQFEGELYLSGEVAPGETAIYKIVNTLSELQSAITKESDEDGVYGSCVLDGVLYFLASVTAGGKRVYSWDGVTKTLDDTLADVEDSTSGGTLYVVGEELYAYGAAVVNRRNAAGTWSTISLPADTTYTTTPVTFDGDIYFAGELDGLPILGVVDVFDGATISRARTLPELDVDLGSSAMAVCVFNGKLCVAWGGSFARGSTALVDRNAVLAEFDGSTWNDEVAEFNVGAYYGPTLLLFEDGTDLYFVTSAYGAQEADLSHYFFHSAGVDTASWSLFETQAEPSGSAGFFSFQVSICNTTGIV